MPGTGAPENITIVFLSPSSVKVSWATTMDNVEKYDVNYKPTNARYVLAHKRKLLCCVLLDSAVIVVYKGKGKVIPLQARCGPEGG